MPLIETESVVLKSHNLAEADRIVVFFTRDYGVVRGVAKGIKRLNSRYGSSFEPFSTVRVTYFQKEDRELVSIQQADLLRSNFEAASDPEVLACFSYIADLLLAFAPPNDPNELMFRMVRACFESNELDLEKLPAIQVYFEIWLLRLGGFLPDWSRCHVCHRQFDPAEFPGIDAGQQFVCEACHKGRLTERAPSGWYKVFQNVQKLSPEAFAADLANVTDAPAVSVILRKVIERSLDRPLAAIRATAIQSR